MLHLQDTVKLFGIVTTVLIAFFGLWKLKIYPQKRAYINNRIYIETPLLIVLFAEG